jgi:Signal transduction histidine kinase
MSINTDELRVLLIEDNPGDATLFEHHLSADCTDNFPPAMVTHVTDLSTGIDELGGDSYDIILLDLGLPESTGLATLDRYNNAVDDREDLPSVPVIVLTGLQDEAAAVEAIERGAQEYLVKDDIDGRLLHRAIRHGLERHRQAQRIRRQNARLERFAHVVSHDLRNPLGVAQGRIELIDDDEHAPTIADNLDRMEAIIDDVLTLAREGKAVEETEPVDLAMVTAGCWESVQTASAGLSVINPPVVYADEGRLQQLLENLFRNSVEHAGDDVAIAVGRLPDGFYVEDDGPGIPEEDRKKIFEAGFSTNPDGTGFGLNIVEEIAAAHGWDVAVTDGSEGGARFEFTEVRMEK